MIDDVDKKEFVREMTDSYSYETMIVSLADLIKEVGECMNQVHTLEELELLEAFGKEIRRMVNYQLKVMKQAFEAAKERIISPPHTDNPPPVVDEAQPS